MEMTETAKTKIKNEVKSILEAFVQTPNPPPTYFERIMKLKELSESKSFPYGSDIKVFINEIQEKAIRFNQLYHSLNNRIENKDSSSDFENERIENEEIAGWFTQNYESRNHVFK
jgi:hypothetical protein